MSVISSEYLSRVILNRQSLFLRLARQTQAQEEEDMAVDGPAIDRDFAPTFNMLEELVHFQVSLITGYGRPPPNINAHKHSPLNETPWSILFKVVTTRVSKNVNGFHTDQGACRGFQPPTT